MVSKCSYNKIISLLKKLHKYHPDFNMGKHLATALDEYKNIWMLKDEEMLAALEKYADEIEYYPRDEKEDIEKIINDGIHHLLDEEEDEEEYYDN